MDMGIRLAVVGSRYFQDFKLLEETLLDLELDLQIESKYVTTVVSGGCRGTDTLAEKYANKYNKKLLIFKPDWSLGKKAGPQRNTLIIDNSDYVVAFPCSNSVGTWDSVRKAQNNGIPVKIVNLKQ